MIELYSGTPGSGKSLHLTEKIKYWIELYKCPVISNFAIKANLLKFKKGSAYIYIDNFDLTPEFLVWFSNYYKAVYNIGVIKEETILLVIDECQLLFNARAWNEKGRHDWISFFTQHRKLGYRVILSAQFAEMIDKQIRALIEYEYVHRKLINIGIYGKIMCLFMGRNTHVSIKIYAPLKQKVATEFFKGNKGLFALYDTYNLFSSV